MFEMINRVNFLIRPDLQRTLDEKSGDDFFMRSLLFLPCGLSIVLTMTLPTFKSGR